jgi:drug/metabolite transporter (DMT)-like permease
MIEEISEVLGGIPAGAVWALLAVSVAVLFFQVAALIDLARRERVLWDRKWVWALIILLVSNGIGALLYFVLGRRVPEQVDLPVAHQAKTGDGEAARTAVDILYGGDDR